MKNINPFENAMQQLAKAAKVIKLSPNILERLKHPDRVLTVSIPVNMDNGKVRVFQGYRSQFNNALGPYKGGLRFHQDVDLNEVKALSFWMAIKNAVVNVPYGGGKGGITVNPKELSKGELEKLSRGFIQKIYRNIGPHVDVPAPDVNTTPQIMSWMVDEYSKLVKKKTLAVITGKPVNKGGSHGRTEATGFGGVEVLKQAAKKLNLEKGATVAIQGFGNVGLYFALFASEAGFKVVALSDSRSGIYDPKGLDIKKVSAWKQKNKQLKGFPKAKSVNNEKLLELPVDVLVPAALENQIHKGNARKIKARLIIEMANGPTTHEADLILEKRKVVVVPDVLSNSGGVATSYLEWYQNLKGKKWSKTVVLNKLDRFMTTAFNDVYKTSIKHKTSLRSAAFILAIKRISQAMK
ncbi:MAG: Glu/Leu/Phe/Val dehydrogenase [bacterium]|nr:Glu/Leu/Phe/Val dehydrogenase [bacterium]